MPRAARVACTFAIVLAGWVIGLVGAPIATPAVMQATGWNVHPLFVMALLFFVLLVLVRLAGVLLSRVLSKVGLGGVDRTLGALLGVARGSALIGRPRCP